MFFFPKKIFSVEIQRETTSGKPYDWPVEPTSRGHLKGLACDSVTNLKAFQGGIGLKLVSLCRVRGRQSTFLQFQFYY